MTFNFKYSIEYFEFGRGNCENELHFCLYFFLNVAPVIFLLDKSGLNVLKVTYKRDSIYRY